MTIRVTIAGATGKVGGPLAKAVAQSGDLELVGAVARANTGKRLGDVIGAAGVDVVIRGTAAEALAVPCDVFVDYTRADAVKAHVLTALEHGAHVVIGSSGLSDADYAELDAIAKQKDLGVFAAGNYAITAVLLQRFARLAAAEIPSWEIIDYSYEKKVDAPSGTARELANQLAAVRAPSYHVPVSSTVGARDARGATIAHTQVHSVRLPGYTSSVEVVFGVGSERLSIRHDSLDPAGPYVGGTLLAIRKVSALRGVVRGLDRLLGT
ncbi:4-hydroxy-tetrahydrodipicolinate reductase [Pendulispora albinea]|uniref:4-hydroxy-tetrahydrodipicolinate reductase n=1 Tax=Pendulispora albinea TaxID=2741071 RepID=A0ABZ2LSF0_9BACT